MAIKKIKYFIYLVILCVNYSCIPPIGNIDEAEESGYVLNVSNYSDIAYTGFTFYNGIIDSRGNFVKIDSLVYNSIKILKAADGDNIRQDGVRFSLVKPFDIDNTKLTKYNTWAPPNFQKINEIKEGGRVSLKFYLHETKKSVIKTPNGIGYSSFSILEDGTLQGN